MAPTEAELAEKALRKIIDGALMLLRDPEWSRQRLLAVGAEALKGFYPDPDLHARAVRRLAEALGI